MIKNITFTLLLLFAAATNYAQSPILAATSNPVPGEWHLRYATDTFYTSFGSTMDAVWHYDTLTACSVDTIFVDSCAASAYCASFPGTNVHGHSSSDAGESFYNANDTVLSAVGFYNTTPIYYNNPEDQLRYPFSYGSSFTDTFASTFSTGGYTYRRSGIAMVRADGYGTLYLPNGTYNNAVRVRTQETYDDSTTVSGSPFAYHYTSLAYTWYVPGMHIELLNITKYYRNSFLISIVSYFTKPTPTAVTDVQPTDIAILLYPNPASDRITLACAEGFETGSWADLYDITGQHIGKFPLSGTNVTIQVSTLPPGMYECRIYNPSHQVTVKKVVLSR